MTREVECQKGEDLHQLEMNINAQEHELIIEATAHVVTRKRDTS
jgi:folate-dependent phosphoribosylglycinamide formyltransferase PurN